MRGERGVALVLVLWLATLLMVVASSFIFASRADTLVMRNSMSMARAEAIADAAVSRAVFETSRTDNAPDMWRRDGVPVEWAFDGGKVRLEIRDESAKIDVNTAADALLHGLFVSIGIAPDEAARLQDAILDWRDPDSLKRPNGAEESDYKAAGLAYKPANAPFQAIEELQLVLGMRPDIFRRVAPLITVHSRQSGVNPATASREVLLAIPGLTPEAVDRFLAMREQAHARSEPVPPFPEAGAFAAPASPLVTSIVARAELDDGTLFVRDAVVMVKPAARRLVTPLVWRQSLANEPAPAPAAPEAGGTR